jgi:5'-3' exonuclease
MKMKPLFGAPKRFNTIDKSQTILLYDSLNLFFSCVLSKAYAAFSTGTGKPSAHIYGPFSRIRGHVRKFTKPGHRVALVFAWDNEPKEAMRILPEYKMNRDESQHLEEEDLHWRLSEYKAFLATFPSTFIDVEDEEADNAIATLAHQQSRKKVFVMSSDKDLWQLLSKPNVKVISLRKSEPVTEADLLKRYDIRSRRDAYKVDLYKAVMGDVSDNIPKVPRIPSRDFHMAMSPLRYTPEDDCIEMLLESASKLEKPRAYTLLQEHLPLIRRNLLLTRLKNDLELRSEYNPGNQLRMEEILATYECNSLLQGNGYEFLFR